MGNFDAILASVPADATAAKVTARGEHWKPERDEPAGLLHWKAPPPTKPYVRNPALPEEDFAGKKFGRFTVIGILAEKGGKNSGQRWVCRCSCGDYEARKHTSIRLALSGVVSTDTPAYRCWYCAQWMTAKGRFAKKGARSLSSFTANSHKIVEAKTPEHIVADQVGELGFDDEKCQAAAVKIIARLNKSGYRIIKEKRQSSPPEVSDADHE